MEKTRVKKGENYWYVTPTGFVSQTYDTGDLTDKLRFEFGNYFYTSGEAESMAKKLCAILKGAGVIEMPSEEEIEDAMKTSVTESIMCVSPLNSFTPQATDLLECAWMKGAEWLKSKIVK